MTGRNRRPRGHVMLRPFLIVVILATLLVFPSFLLTELICWLAGRPVTMMMRLVVTVIWFFVEFTLMRVLLFFTVRAREKKGFPRPPNVMEEALEALDQMASGDYDVNVQTGERYHHNFQELADKINQLARDLSSVEQMRQEFISNVSHEIQSPLTSISGFAALLKKEDLPPERRLHYVEVIEAESNRLSKLSDNLLKLSLLESEQAPVSPEPYRLDKQLEDILLLLEPQWAPKELELDVALEPVTLDGDRDLLSQVWINLIHNSIKFTGPGGTISVSLAVQGEVAVCAVSDTGAGIPEEGLVRVFERFYKADKARDRSLGGNGLGLSLVKKIVDLHHGKITVQSALGKGTTFTVTLPLGPPR